MKKRPSLKNAGTIAQHQEHMRQSASQRVIAGFLRAQANRRFDKKVTELDSKNSLVGGLLVTRPDISIESAQQPTQDQKDGDHTIHSPMFYVVNEISIDGQETLLTVILNAPSGSPATLKDIGFTDDFAAENGKASLEGQTLYYGGHFSHPRLNGGKPSVQFLVETDREFITRIMPGHPYLKLEQQPRFMVLSESQLQSYRADKAEKGQDDPQCFAFEGFFMVPKAAMLHSLILSDVFLVKQPENDSILFEPSAAKYMNAFREVGLKPKQIRSTVTWAHQTRQGLLQLH